MNVTDWGNYPVVNPDLHKFRCGEEFVSGVEKQPSLITRGLGRCYGDSALNEFCIFSTQRFDHMIAFDNTTGELVCEAGVSLEEILKVFVPRGWFLPVTPGTKFVTVGGGIASDVHGKNHHAAGSFSRYVNWIDLLTADGKILRCSREQNADLFHGVCGGQGLLGIVLYASFNLVRLSSVFIRQEMVKAANLHEIMDLFDSSANWTFSVAWTDCLKSGSCLGRSLLMRGEFEPVDALDVKRRHMALRIPNKRKLDVPMNFPSLALNSLSVRLFNEIYYHKAPSGTTERVVDYDTFFYPLDGIHRWNRIYGKRGFTQYQFVLPKAASYEGLAKILDRISDSGQGSFLAVLKRFGKGNSGVLSFPMEGYSLALDFPITRRLFPLLDELDAMVLDYGGRHYLTKDVRMSRDVFDRGYGVSAERFRELKRNWDPQNKFVSLQSQRLGIGG